MDKKEFNRKASQLYGLRQALDAAEARGVEANRQLEKASDAVVEAKAAKDKAELETNAAWEALSAVLKELRFT